MGDGRGLLPRCARALFAALDSALAGLDFSGLDPRRVSVFFGTSVGGIFEAENALERNLAAGADSADWRALRFYECSSIALAAAKHFGFMGECATYSTACSSSSLALADACNAIVCGDCAAAVVCGADAISRITVNGFGSLLLLSQSRARPFDAARDGINLGEAGAVLVLASGEAAKKISKKNPLAHVAGWACSADAHHATAPHPEGEGAFRAMAEAVEMSGLGAGGIDFVLAHGTGTKGNDSAEFCAMQKLFGAAVPPYASVKRAFGHTLGASGALNAAIALEAMRRQMLVPNLGFENLPPDISAAPVKAAKSAKIESALTSSLGFGGNNSAAVLSLKPVFFGAPRRARAGVYSMGAVEPPAGECEVDASSLLADTPPLKKRRWAKLQQMAVECAGRALKGVEFAAPAEKIGVCLGTGMGMVSETRRFVEAAILKREAEPIPSAFTNSVHNAAASAVSVKFGLKGLNSAATAKEVSFECALRQALRAIASGGLEAALVGSCDERSEEADEFLKTAARFSGARASRDFAGAYLIASPGALGGGARPFAEIAGAEISRRMNGAGAELAAAAEFAEKCFGEGGKIAGVFAYCPQNAWHRRLAESVLSGLSANFGAEIIADFSPASYSDSAGAIRAAAAWGAGKYLSYTLSSCGLRAVSAFEIL